MLFPMALSHVVIAATSAQLKPLQEVMKNFYQKICRTVYHHTELKHTSCNTKWNHRQMALATQLAASLSLSCYAFQHKHSEDCMEI